MERVSKDSRRIEAYGTVDEVNALVGVVRPTGHDDIDEKLQRRPEPSPHRAGRFRKSDPEDDDPRILERTSRRWKNSSTRPTQSWNRSNRSSSHPGRNPGRSSTTPARSVAAQSAAVSPSPPRRLASMRRLSST